MNKKKAEKKNKKKKDNKEKSKKKKILKKKDSKKKILKKKESKKKDRKKNIITAKKTKKGKKEKNKKKALPKKKESLKTTPLKIDSPTPLAKVQSDHSSNYNVRDGLYKLRSLKTPEDVQAFTRGEKRLTLVRAVPGVIRRLSE